jgi:hypothetical protein
MANVIKKHSISSELAQKMVLKAFSRMDGAPILYPNSWMT